MMGRCSVLRLNVVLVVVLFCGVTHGRHMAPFIDPSCLSNRDCSWNWHITSTTQNGTQFCITDFPKAFDICPNHFVVPDGFGPDNRPEPAKIYVQNISKTFLSESGEMEQYTCFRISVEINHYSASNVKGIQMSVRGKDMPDLNKLKCFNMNFSSAGLEYNSVLSHLITSECFCGLRPNRKYEVAVTTMPVDSVHGVHDTTIRKEYTISGCDQADQINDTRCYKSKEALWEPDCILVEQNLTTGFYNLFDFSFNVAPADYKFDKYQIVIVSSATPNLPIQILSFVMSTVRNKTCSQSDKSMEFVTVSDDTLNWGKIFPWSFTPGILLEVKVEAVPTERTCLDEQNDYRTCKTSSPQTFPVLSDPCTDNPCGINGTCTSNVEDHICNCDPGFTVFDKTCKVDPCKILDGSDTYASRCQNGECIYNDYDFYCQCNANFIPNAEKKECLANPCAIIPEANTTFCGVHGECKVNVTTGVADGRCRCEPGYVTKDSKMACTADRQAMVIKVAVGSCLLGLLLFMTILFIYRRLQQKKPDVEIIPRRDDPGHLVEVVRKKRVLPIYSDDHPLHYEVVVKFCRFLKRHCQCDVALMEWESIGPTVEMWLTNQINEADVVLLICSKGTGLKYMAKAKQKQMDSSGVYGDMFVKALFLLEDYFSRDNACGKFFVTYFDYSTEDDIPVPFKRFAKYKLMQSMETLYLHIHNKVMESPTSSRRVHPLHESNYPKLEMGKYLYEAIEAMKRLVKSDKKWYHKQDSKRNTNGRPAVTIDIEQPFIDRWQGETDSAYNTGDLNEDKAPSSFFKIDNRQSIGQDSDYSDFEESLKQIQNRAPAEPLTANYTQPGPQFFTDDVNVMIDPEMGHADHLNSWDDIQMRLSPGPYNEALC